jgi:gliding motility-associated-like protein
MTLSVEMTSTDGCVSSDSITISVIKNYPVFIPNAFSPNFDGVNDYFFPNGNAAAQRLLSFKVYSRWGGELFQLQDKLMPMSPQEGWDGKVKGKPVPTGTYTWTAVVEFQDGEVRSFSGAVHLTR